MKDHSPEKKIFKFQPVIFQIVQYSSMYLIFEF